MTFHPLPLPPRGPRPHFFKKKSFRAVSLSPAATSPDGADDAPPQFYADGSSGRLLTWRALFLRSRALEILLAGLLDAPPTGAGEPAALAQLLAAALPTAADPTRLAEEVRRVAEGVS